MTTHERLDLRQPIALNAEGKAPTRVHLLPAGPEVKGRDGRRWRLSDPHAIVAAFNASNGPLPIDYEHDSAKSGGAGPKPAAGWIEGLEVDDKGIWGLVSWTPRAAQMIAGREYRFLSPAITFDAKTKEVSALHSAGLVHKPNFDLTALNNQQQETDMLKSIAFVLGLPETADINEILAAINALKQAATAVNAANGDVVLAGHYHEVVAELNSVNANLERARRQQQEARAEALIDHAVRSGKVTPAVRADYLDLALNSYDRAAAIIEKLPVIVAVGVDPDLERATVELNSMLAGRKPSPGATELDILRNVGLSEDDYRKAAREE